MAGIPKLRLGNVECGGGWGLGEQFAKLPSHDEQRAGDAMRIYTVAKVRATRDHSSDDETHPAEQTPQPAVVAQGSANVFHTTQYAAEREDDDDTFVDHGSNMEVPHANESPQRPPLRVVVPPYVHNTPGGAPAEDDSIEDYWEDGRLVSRVHCREPIYGLVVVGGKSLWTAIGDDPLTLFELSGCDLAQQRSMSSITGVRSMALVPVPAARAPPVSFKQVGSTSSKASGAALSRSNSSNPNLSNSQGEVQSAQLSGSSETLWCGLDRGRIAIVDLFFFSDAGVLLAHNGNTTVCGVWAAGSGRVWTAGEDHSLKLWDASTRKNIRLLKMSECVVDVCYVPISGHVWVTCREARILVFNHDGQEVRLKGSSFLKTKSRVHTMRFHQQGGVVWVAMEHEIAAYHPKTYELLSGIQSLSCRAMELTETHAILVGHQQGQASDEDQIIIVNISDARHPCLEKFGAPLDGISKVGLRCFTRTPLAVAAHMDGEQRCLTVFTTEGTEPIGNWGTDGRSVLPAGTAAGDGDHRRSDTVDGLRNTANPAQLRQMLQPGDEQIPADGGTPHAHGGSSATNEEEGTTRIAPTEGMSSSSIRAPAALGRPSSFHEAQHAAPRYVIDPRMQANFQELQQELSDMTKAIRVLRVQQPIQDDFGKLYKRCVHISATLAGSTASEYAALLHGGTQDEDALRCSTSEGHVISSVLDKLVQALPISQKEITASVEYGPTGPRTDKTERPTAPAPFTLQEAQMHRHLQQMMRSAETQRNQMQETIVSLQRQLQRMSDKNAALMRGASQLEGALSTHNRQALAAAYHGCDEDDDVESLGAQNDRRFHAMGSLDGLSTTGEIMEAFQQLQDNIDSLLTSQRHMQHANSIMASARSSIPAPEVHTTVGPMRTPSGLSTGRDRQTLVRTPTPFSLRPQTPTPSTTPVPSHATKAQAAVKVTPKRLFSTLRNELLPVELFSKGIAPVLCRIEGSFCRLESVSSTSTSSFDSSPALHDLLEAEVMCTLCRHEVSCMVVEELISAVSDAHQAHDEFDLPTPVRHSQGRAPGVLQQWFVSMAGIDKDELDSAITHMTTVSIDLDAAGAQVRASLVRRYLSGAVDPQTHTGQFAGVLERVKATSCRLRGLLAWEHAWLRCLALALDEVQTTLMPTRLSSPQPRGANSTQSQGVSLPRGVVEFMLQKLVDWKHALTEMRQETEVLFGGLSEGQRVAGGESPDTELSSDLSRASLISVCLQLSVRKCSVNGTLPAMLVDDASNRGSSSDARCDDLYGLLSEVLENIGAVLQTKIDALLPVCSKLESVLRSALASLPESEAEPTAEGGNMESADGDDVIVLVFPLPKPPLEECHKQFCMAI